MSEELLQTETMADLEEHFDDANPWNLVADYIEKGTVLSLKVEGVVNGGVIVMVEGLRGFVPASQLSLSYIENLEDYLLQDIQVQVIEADQAANRLILSARGLLKAKQKADLAVCFFVSEKIIPRLLLPLLLLALRERWEQRVLQP